jgi:hypothetical protein
MVDETGIENLYIKGTWVQLGSSKELTITQGTITLQNGTYAIKSGGGWAEEDGTFTLTITVEMGPFYEPCEPQPSPSPCEPCPPETYPSEPCPSPPTGECATVKAYDSSYQLGAWDVDQGETFTIYPASGEDVLPSSVDFYVCGRKVTVDVSCSLKVGDKFDGFKVVSVEKFMSEECDSGCKDGCSGCGGCGCKSGCSGYGYGGYGYSGYGCSGYSYSGCGCSGYGYSWYGCKDGYGGYGYKSGCSGYGYGGYGYKSGCSGYGYSGCGYKDGCKDECSSNYGCSCNYGDDCGQCEEKCMGIKSLTLKYIGECCGDCGSDSCNVLPVCEDGQGDGCNVPSNCCDSSTPESPTLCAQYKTVTIELKGKYCNIVTFEEIVGEVKQPVSGCCYVPTYVYKYTYQSDFSFCVLFDADHYVSFSGTFTWR